MGFEYGGIIGLIILALDVWAIELHQSFARRIAHFDAASFRSSDFGLAASGASSM